MKMLKKIGIIGCGFLGNIVADAYNMNLLPGYELVGVVSRTKEKRDAIAEKCNTASLQDVDSLLDLKPQIVVETASVQAVKDNAEKILLSECDFAPISIGAFADLAFFEKAKEAAKKGNSRLYLAAGAVGGFDVIQTVTLMAQAQKQSASAGILTHTGAKGFRNTPVWEEHLLTDEHETTVFTGSAKEAIQTFPRRVNVAVATSLASLGPDNTNVTQISVPNWQGDYHCITFETDGIKATVDIYSRTSSIAGWSLVALLRNINSEVCFY